MNPPSSKKNAPEAAIASYLAAVGRVWRTGVATEHSYRGALQDLLSALLPGFSVVNEPKHVACGAPDFILQRRNLPVAFVEAKDIGDDDLAGTKKSGNREQFDRYKASLDTLAFTDYLDFRLFLHGQPSGAVRIGEVRHDRIAPLPENFPAFLDLVRALGSTEPRKISTAPQLARLMAAKARLLQDAASRFLRRNDSSDAGGAAGTTLGKLMSDFRRILMPEVGIGEFSDIYAQTVTYGMFAARLHARTPEGFSRLAAAALIPKSNPFLKDLFTQLATNLEDEIAWVVDGIAELFAVADVPKIMADYGNCGGVPASDPMIHFYEDFLAAYDAGLRKDRGVWYTPLPVVRFIVGAVDSLLQSAFGLPDGLADASKTELAPEEFKTGKKGQLPTLSRRVHRVQVLDPATGTGTFLAECIWRIHAKFKGNEGMWPGYVAENLLPRLNGFELLMASYTMAHVKLDMVLAATGFRRDAFRRFNVFLTDSLSDGGKDACGQLFSLTLGNEAEAANRVKRDCPVMVVLGNPPYNGESGNRSRFIMDLMESYQKEPGGKEKLKERNPKWINDDYVKFIRLAEDYVERNGSGIAAFINPHGYLDAPTFRGMRWRLMQTFDEIYVLNLHGNAKKKETAPDGSKDENVFAIMQGVCIDIFVKTGKHAGPCRVFYADLFGKRADKFSFLESTAFADVPWQELSPSAPMYFFVPKNAQGEEEYAKGFSITELFPVGGCGITSAHDDFVSGTETDLLTRFSSFRDSKPMENLYKKFGVKEKSGWDIHKGHSELQGCQNLKAFIQPFAYRLFDRRHIFYQDSLIWRSVRRIFDNFILGPNLGLVVKRGFPLDAPPVFVTDCISEFRYWSRSGMEGGDYVFPLHLYRAHMGTMLKESNLDETIIAKIEETTGKTTPEEIFAYIYAVLHTPEYRARYKEFLKVDFPRVPYPKDRKTFRRLASIGQKLVETHLLKDPPPPLSEKTAVFPKAGDCRVEEVRREDGKVFINAVQYFDNVADGEWEAWIGGYQPARKWLKDRKGRILAPADLLHYRRIVLALRRTRELVSGLSALAPDWL
jgi:hypothetical protein